MIRQANPTTTLIAVAMLLLILFVSAGYILTISATDEAPVASAARTSWEENRARWDASAPQSFRYVVERMCFCRAEYTTPYVATEEHGQRRAEFRVEIERSDGTFTATPDQPMWIADIFEQIGTAIESTDYEKVEVSYDPRYGYPLAVELQSRYADGHTQFFVRDFEVLEHRQE